MKIDDFHHFLCVFVKNVFSECLCPKTHVFNFSNYFLTGPSQNKAHFKSFFHQVQQNANMFATTNMCFHAYVVRIPINHDFSVRTCEKHVKMMKILMFFVALQKFCLSDPSVPKDPRITTSCHFLTRFSKFCPNFWPFCQKTSWTQKSTFCKVF